MRRRDRAGRERFQSSRPFWLGPSRLFGPLRTNSKVQELVERDVAEDVSVQVGEDGAAVAPVGAVLGVVARQDALEAPAVAQRHSRGGQGTAGGSLREPV